jgi:hypothetical protein
MDRGIIHWIRRLFDRFFAARVARIFWPSAVLKAAGV